MSVEEGTHILADGKQLFTKTFRTEGPPKARLVFIHGFSDVWLPWCITSAAVLTDA
jgi:acylglycerol lipase